MSAAALPPGVSRTTAQVWIFVLIEAVIFGSYFGVYMLRRAQEPALFLASQARLSQDFGFANTAILITSSWTIARAVLAIRGGHSGRASRLTVATMLLGCCFIGSKLIEWSFELRQGYGFTSNAFFTFYYFLTAIHVLHVLIGLTFLTVATLQIRTSASGTAPALETGAIVWHMVDFLWVIIFALLYVMR